jgi:hypothetical protein
MRTREIPISRGPIRCYQHLEHTDDWPTDRACLLCPIESNIDWDLRRHYSKTEPLLDIPAGHPALRYDEWSSQTGPGVQERP